MEQHCTVERAGGESNVVFRLLLRPKEGGRGGD